MGMPWKCEKLLTSTQYFYLISLFGSLSYHLQFHRVYIWLYLGFCSMRWGSFGISVGHWDSYGLKQRNPWKKSKITYSYLIFLFITFFVHFIIISRSKELIFDYIEALKEYELRFFRKNWKPLRQLLPETW